MIKLHKIPFALHMLFGGVLLLSCANKSPIQSENPPSSSDPSQLDGPPFMSAQMLYEAKCDMCHNKIDSIHTLTAPALVGITNEVSREWFLMYVKESFKLQKEKDPRALCLYEHWRPTYMPSFKDSLSDDQINTLYDYLAHVTAKMGVPYGYPCD